MKSSIFSLGETFHERRASVYMLLLGTFMQTQINIGGYAGISETVLVALFPFLCLKNYSIFTEDKCATILYLLIIWIIGVVCSDLYNDIIISATVRGLTPPVSLLASIIVIYPLLRKNPNSLKWYLVGTFFSSIISIFIFQTGADVGNYEVLSGHVSAVEAVMGYKLFWVNRITSFISLPITGWYTVFPHKFSILLVLALAVFGLYEGGRSTFALGMVKVMLLAVGGHTAFTMRRMRKNVFPIMIIIGFVAIISKGIYATAAKSGWMGEAEYGKYEKQAEGKSLMEILMAGRTEFFIASSAIKDHPFIGHGSMAIDKDGYVLRFVQEYGTDEELRLVLYDRQRNGDRTIPAHSHIVLYWMWAGLAGLLPWIYILYLIISTIFRRIYVIPIYFGYIVVVGIGAIWNIFFSPFGMRMNMAVLISVCLLIRTIDHQQKRGFLR